jgi:hypothetical protein
MHSTGGNLSVVLCHGMHVVCSVQQGLRSVSACAACCATLWRGAFFTMEVMPCVVHSIYCVGWAFLVSQGSCFLRADLASCGVTLKFRGVCAQTVVLVCSVSVA